MTYTSKCIIVTLCIILLLNLLIEVLIVLFMSYNAINTIIIQISLGVNILIYIIIMYIRCVYIIHHKDDIQKILNDNIDIIFL
jgi:hypothetical protein